MALRTIRIFISSPGDVAEERLIARRLIGRLEAQFGGLLQFEAVLWERVPLVATASFQEQLVSPSDTDVVVLILWSRIGTPLPPHITRPDGTTYASGTEFEFEDAINAFRRSGRPRILAYFKTAPTVASGDLASLEEAATQKRVLDRFIATWFRNAADGTLKGAFHNFAAPADFEELLEAHLSQLAESFIPEGMTVRASAPTWRGRSPFRGLQVFEPEHAAVFFGRTAATATVLAKLRAQGHAGRAFVLIVSMSGAGKSSLIRAGVLPLLLQPGVVGTATIWRHAVVRPGDGQGRLVDPLVKAIVRATAIPGDREDEEPLAPSADAVVSLVVDRLARVARAAPPDAHEIPACHLALVVDQLEETFSDDRIAAAEREAFFFAIDALARSGVAWIVSSMRSDSYFRIAESPTLVALKEGDGQFDLMPPSVREIGQIIRLPAMAAGLRFEMRPNTAEKLDDAIRDAAARNPGALPLLQFLLEELYQRRSVDDILTFRAYEELGGVEGALAQHAEKVIADVSDAARESMSSVLRELVTFGADDESRALRRVALRTAFTAAAANELVDALLEARLLVSSSGVDGMAVVSVAHEALLEFWPRMKAGVEEDRELLLVHARLEAATREWERNGRTIDLLLQRGKPLTEALEVVAAGIRLSDAETALVDASQRRARAFKIVRASAVAGLAVLAVVAGVAAYRARVESARAQVQATTAQRTTDFMVSLFADADPDQSKGDKVTVRDVLDRGVTQIDKELAGEGAVRANLLRAMGQAYNGLGLFPKARQVLEKAVAQSEQAQLSDDRVKARIALADNRYQDGDYEAAESIYRTALAEAQALHGDQGDEVALSTTGLAETLADNHKEEEAEQRYHAALAMNIKRHGEESLGTARVLDGLGRLLFGQSRYPEAEKIFKQALEIRERLLGPGDSSVALSLNNLGVLYYQIGQFDRSADAYARALPIYQHVFGPTHPRVAAILNNLGRAELIEDQLTPARAHIVEALDIWRKSLSATHDELILPLNSLAMIQMSEGELKSAHATLDEAMAIAKPRKHWMLNQLVANEAELAVQENRLDEADLTLQEARTRLDAQYGSKLSGSESWRTAVLDLTEAELRQRQGEPDLAAALVSKAFPLLVTHFGTTSYYANKSRRIYTPIGSR